jgi:hypothetical protein
MLLASLPLLLAAPAMLPPHVDRLSPLGAQRGTEVELTLRGQRLGEPQGLLLSGPGIEVLAVAADKDANSCRAQLRIAADCELGAHALRLRTAAGLGNLVQFFVGAVREVQEQRQGSAPMPIASACTVDAAITGEETDRYLLDLPVGAQMVVEVEAMRLGRAPIDLALSVRAPDGSELLRVDDSALGHKDPWLSFTAAVAGAYEVRVASAFPDGQNEGPYRVHFGALPRPVAALPCGGEPGSTLAVELLGDRRPMRALVLLPADGDDWFPFYPADERGTAPTPVWLRVGGPPEQAPAAGADGALHIAVPGSVSGVVDTEAGARFVLPATKGAPIELRALALGLHSPLDPVLEIRQLDGKLLASDDDGGGGVADSFLRFQAPADGDYAVVVRDLLRRHSPAHVFRLECGNRPRSTHCRLVVNRGQEPVLDVPQGGACGGVLQLDVADGKDLDAGLALAAAALPAGVTAVFGRIQKGVNLVPVVLTAAADAPLADALGELSLNAGQEPRQRPAGYAQVLPLVTVRNDQPILTVTQRRLPVAVTRKAPFALAIDAPKVPLIRGAPLGVVVHVQRSEGFAGDVRLKALWTPPGVSGGEITVPKDQGSGVLPLEANGNAPLGPFALAVTGTSTVGNEGFEQGSAFAEVAVDKPWLTASVQGARTIAGTPVELAVDLHQDQPFAGAVHVKLLGLPKGTSAPELTLDAAATKATLAVAVDAGSAVGRFQSLALEVRVPKDGADVVHRFPVGELRIDAPAPKETGSKETAPKEPSKEVGR